MRLYIFNIDKLNVSFDATDRCLAQATQSSKLRTCPIQSAKRKSQNSACTLILKNVAYKQRNIAARDITRPAPVRDSSTPLRICETHKTTFDQLNMLPNLNCTFEFHSQLVCFLHLDGLLGGGTSIGEFGPVDGPNLGVDLLDEGTLLL